MKEAQGERTKDEAKAFYQKVRKSNVITWVVIPFLATVALGLHQTIYPLFGGRPHPPFQATSIALQACLNRVCGSNNDCVRYPGEDGFYRLWVNPYNQARIVKPAAVIRPKSPEDIAAIVKCAATNNVKVQAKSGGHSYA
jgi:hypothetical protein